MPNINEVALTVKFVGTFVIVAVFFCFFFIRACQNASKQLRAQRVFLSFYYKNRLFICLYKSTTHRYILTIIKLTR